MPKTMTVDVPLLRKQLRIVMTLVNDRTLSDGSRRLAYGLEEFISDLAGALDTTDVILTKYRKRRPR